MPITTSERTTRYRSSLATFSDGRPPVEVYSTGTVFVSVLNKPDASRRKKPLLLSDSWTARSVASSRWAVTQPLVRRYESSTSTQTITIYMPWISSALDPRYLPTFTMSASLQNRLLNKIKDQKVNLAVSMAELGRTTDMVVGLARDIVRAFRSLLSGRMLGDLLRGTARGPRDLSGRAAKRWLEYVYGWVPTLNEIHGLSELIHQKIKEGKTIRTTVSEPINQNYLGINVGSGLTYDCFLEGRMKAMAEYRVDPGYLRSLSQSGITNPALVAWELVPYSFVIDWVIGVGDYLSALDALVGVKDFQCYPSYGYKARYEFKHINTDKSARSVQSGSAVAMAQRSVRLPKATSLSPRLPSYEPSLSNQRLVSALALLRNLVK